MSIQPIKATDYVTMLQAAGGGGSYQASKVSPQIPADYPSMSDNLSAAPKDVVTMSENRINLPDPKGLKSDFSLMNVNPVVFGRAIDITT